jgi:hypothetical protein
MVITSYFFAGLEEQDAAPHGHQSEGEHRDQPDCQITFNHKSTTLFSLMAIGPQASAPRCQTPLSVAAGDDSVVFHGAHYRLAGAKMIIKGGGNPAKRLLISRDRCPRIDQYGQYSSLQPIDMPTTTKRPKTRLGARKARLNRTNRLSAPSSGAHSANFASYLYSDRLEPILKPLRADK